MTIHNNFKDIEEFIASVPSLFEKGEGEVIYKGRNELRCFSYGGKEFIVKSFRRPHFINRLVYGFIRPSKASRAYQNAIKLMELGVGTPVPVAYIDIRSNLLFDKSYLITLKSECSHVYVELFQKDFKEEEQVLREIGRVTAIMHNKGYVHKDYGCGNILFENTPEGVKIEMVDLNRMYFGKVDIKMGCKNFERLPCTPQMHKWIAQEYAKGRNFNPDECLKYIVHYRKLQPGRIEDSKL